MCHAVLKVTYGVSETETALCKADPYHCTNSPASKCVPIFFWGRATGLICQEGSHPGTRRYWMISASSPYPTGITSGMFLGLAETTVIGTC